MMESKRDRRKRVAATNRIAIEKISADRVAARVCRHCGGPLPCWSPYGDRKPGIRNPR